MITLTTDFGTDSPYVAQMKGVILARAPTATIVDVTHAIHPQNIVEAAWVLGDVVEAFPADAIHVVVVDPGVGSKRRIICVEFSLGTYIAPDNGVLTRLVQCQEPQSITHVSEVKYWRDQTSHTFHGRDIMAPVAAALEKGLSPSRLGAGISEIELLELPQVTRTQRGISGSVIYVDSFGNLITNISRSDFFAGDEMSSCRVLTKGVSIAGIGTHYAVAGDGAILALFGSSDRLEIAEVGGHAQRKLGIEVGTVVQVQW